MTPEALVIPCAGAQLAGVLHRPAAPARRGVLVVVGGPQYRVGSHRQFVLLARHLAAAGFPVLRFDFRGMGDSDGDFPGFEGAGPDIGAAVAAFGRAVPELQEVVLWGLCDGASVAAFFAADAGSGATGGPGVLPVAGLVLANPWVRTEQGLARSYVQGYYGQRLLQRDLWLRLFTGKMNVLRAAGGFLGDLARALGGRPRDPGAGGTQDALPVRFEAALRRFAGPVGLILSGADLTAREFSTCLESAAWARVRQRPGLSRRDLPGADHTFSREEWTREASEATLAWLRSW